MRELNGAEIKKVSGGKTDWDKYNANHGITGPINYGNLPHPPNYGDFKTSIGEGAAIGFIVGGPVGAIDGAIVGAGGYMAVNAWNNVRDYYGY